MIGVGFLRTLGGAVVDAGGGLAALALVAGVVVALARRSP